MQRAEHANDAAAREFFSSRFVPGALRHAGRNPGWLFVLLLFILLAPLLARKSPAA
jgi:hypothetical protein